MPRLPIVVPLLLLGACATAAVSQRPLAPADFVVRGIDANLDSARVVAMLGAPDSATTEANPYDAASHFTLLIYPALRVQLGNGKALGVWITGPGAATTRGLRVGDPAERVRRLYGPPDGRLQDVLEYPDPGDLSGHHVVRAYVANGRVSQIYVGWAVE